MNDKQQRAALRCVVARLRDARGALHAAEKAVVDAKCYVEDFALDAEGCDLIALADDLLRQAGSRLDHAIEDLG